MTEQLSKTIAHALLDSGVTLATHVPGHGATQSFAAFRALSDSSSPISFHEEAAYGVALGAALAGRRAACIIKSHGLSKVLNAALDSLSSGVTAALVNVVFEDKTGVHSDNIIEIEPVIAGCGLPYRMSNAGRAYEDLVAAVAESERLRLPYTVVFDSAEIEKDSPRGTTQPAPVPRFERDPSQHLVCPVFGGYQHAVLAAKREGKDWRAVAKPSLPTIPDSLPPDYQRAVAPYLPVFAAFSSVDYDFVCGDAGVSTLAGLPPYDIVSAALYMGGSVPVAAGAYLAGARHSWAFTGDFSFIAAGHYGLVECVLRKLPVKILLFANGRAQTTGGQTVDLAILHRLLCGYEEFVRRIEDPTDSAKMTEILREANESSELRIVVANFA